ncbi:MAG TPA: HD domain-containing phosphohydrolase [Geobacteraceae bacterium]|nr:HD domain-containing phosphohydrolase [Geobacteraceae bacterium]
MTVENMNNVRNFIRHLVSAVSGSSLYSPEHRQVVRLTQDAFANLQRVLEGKEDVALMVVDDELVCDKAPLEGSMYVDKFIGALAVKGISHLRITGPVEFNELQALIRGLARQGESAGEISSSANIRIGKVEVHDSSTDEYGDTVDDLADVLELWEIPDYERELFIEIRECIHGNRKPGMPGVNRVVRSCIRAFGGITSPHRALAPLRALDEYTFTHSTNVCILNLAQAMAMGIDGPSLQEIGVAGMLHDIGKLFVPEEILSKPGALSEAEREIIQQHPVRGAHYLLDMPGVPKLAVVCSYEHHMKFDGTGYPGRRQGWRQNMCSHMTTISDCFDALRTIRVYRGAMDAAVVAEVIAEKAGTDFHPVLARNFLRILFDLQADVSPMGRDT